jgi:nodulation protein E
MARGAEILAEVVGFAMTSDAADIVMPSQQGAARAIAGALKDARLDPEIGYINAHGTGTAANDKVECAAVANAFGPMPTADDLVDQVHARPPDRRHRRGGASGLHHGAEGRGDRADHRLRGTRPECALDVVPNEAREAQVDAVLSNAFAFGGLNAVLVLTSA